MKIAPNLNFTVVEPTKSSLENFVQMIRTVYQNLIQAINGNLGFGDGTNLDNINGSWINAVTPVASNTDFTVNHNLQRIPSGYWVMQKDRAVDIYTGSVTATSTQITLRATVASAAIRLFIIGLLFSLMAARSEAQGAAHQNIAIKATTPSGALGVGGPILQPISSAIITVCNGSTLPSAGVTCTGLASVFSNIALTSALSNPTNADVNGNFVFYATAGTAYVISVGGVGVTTYSYVWTAPVVAASSGANTALSNLSTVSINTSLLPQVGVDLGGVSNQFRNLYLYGSGTYGTNYFVDTGTPTAIRTQTKQDVSDTYVYRISIDVLQNKTFDVSLNTLKAAVNTAGHVPRNNGTQYVDSTLAASDLSNGVTGSGAVVLQNTPTIATPVINGASTGTGVQGTDSKLATASVTASSTGQTVCMDANGGITNGPCGANSGRNTSVCSTGAGAGSTCSTAVSLDHTEPDTNYATSVTCVGPTQFPFILGVTKSTTQVTVTLVNGTASEAQVSTCAELDVVVSRK